MSLIGNYNARAPQLLGMEWVPIRDFDLTYSPTVNAAELGVGYTQVASTRIRDARFYVNDLPAPPAVYQVAQVNLYPFGTEDQTGPIREVIIPVNSVGVTGSAITLNGASTYPEALYQPGDSKYVRFGYNSGNTQTLALFFAVNAYPELANKRILNVSMLYAGSAWDVDTFGNPMNLVNPLAPTQSMTLVSQLNNLGTGQNFNAPSFSANTGSLALSDVVDPISGTPIENQVIRVLDLGDINNCWDSAAPAQTSEKLPWRYADLQRFEVSSGTARQFINIQTIIPLTTGGISGAGTSVVMYLDYVALRVIYCEEKRTAYGGKQFGYSYGMNSVTLRDTSQTADPTIAAGLYLPTLSFVSMGQVGFGFGLSGGFPQLNATRELYPTPPHPSIQVDVPFPLHDRLGDTFTSTTTRILPQLTLHASGGPLIEPHVYGRQLAAQIYGSNTATQDINDDISGVTAVYPQVRFYARRFGDTTIPLLLSGVGALSGSTASISVAVFDELAEIVDGWREVTLRFSTPPSMGAVAGFPSWTWSAAGETAGNRWEILGAAAPAISGTAGSLYTLVPSPHQLGPGTYQPPSGTGVELTWMPQGVASPWVTGATIDAASDAFLLFSQDPATITGVSLTQWTQAVSGVGIECDEASCCIPTGIGYQAVTWSPPAGTAVLVDTFERTSSGWGTADTGQTYTDSGGTVPGNYPVANGEAQHVLDGVANVARTSVVAGSFTDSHQRITASINVAVAGASMRSGLIGHYVDANNYDVVDFRWATSGMLEIVIASFVAGVQTGLTNVSVGPYAVDQEWYLDADFNGTVIRAKAWPTNLAEPLMVQAQAAATFTTGGYGVRSVRSTGNTNTTAIMTYDDYMVSPSTLAWGAYELQRWDNLADDFETIMLATDPTLTRFNDFEARVGIDSVYRLRLINALNFYGSWSTMVTGAPAAPGITGGCDDMTGALIFTSNADQTGANNAAYIMQWDNEPIEQFTLPEADEVAYQPMYGRDGTVAFHGTERGLEEFSRNVLLHAAAIDPTRLADAQTIRDLAWADLPYVCVRDDIGDRWFSSVRVPSVSARLNRTRYMARLDIKELTQTPAQVDP